MYIGDLHIHSRYSRATSKDCTPEYLDFWAGKKGIDIIGTGDFTHPAWRAELSEKLEPAEDGLYVLKKEYRLPGASGHHPRFVVTGEISSIYKKGERVRKVHSLLILPGLEAADTLSRQLELIGNIHSDGRPILGISCRDLLETMLQVSPEGIFIPAHIWTPHFSLFGAFSGFDKIEDCFEDLTPYIHALETGLSSDPPMNWRVSALDQFFLISNSDAHSPAKLGREANLFDIELSYTGLSEAIQKGIGLTGTIEFFPEEGKYHFDGHRKCGLCISPSQTSGYGNICPVCGKKITIGVLNRIEQLADRKEGFILPKGRPFESLVPLLEVIGASTGISPTGKKAMEQYEHMTETLGPEFTILRNIPIEDIRRNAGSLIAEGINKLRKGQVERTPGFDGEYGKISLLTPEDISSLEGQISLFTASEIQNMNHKQKCKNSQSEIIENKTKIRKQITKNIQSALPIYDMNDQQKKAAEQIGATIAVIAGPGTGKTKTLIARLQFLLEVRKISQEEITAVTFTSKAAEEMKSRMFSKALPSFVQIGTFHAICSHFLKETGLSFVVADTGLQMELAQTALLEFKRKESPNRFLQDLSKVKNGLSVVDEKDRQLYDFYQNLLQKSGALDYDDLLLETINILKDIPENALERKPFSYLLIDEFQDINPLQYQLMKEWRRGGKELFVIGDPDQSIYGFRGCNPDIFHQLSKDYPNPITIRLKENYRSTSDILQAALGVISHNKGEERRMETLKKEGFPIRIVPLEDEWHEAIFVAKEINRQIGGIDMLDTEDNKTDKERPVRGFSDIAVLYRTHRQAAILEKCLKQEGIPYQVAGRENFLTEREVRTALYFFRHILYPQEKPAKELCQKLLFSLLGSEWENQFVYLTGKYQKKVHKNRPIKLLEEWFEDISSNNQDVIKKLINMSVLYTTMEAFLHTLSFGEDGDIRRNGGRKIVTDTVNLMTLHGSKGLEFPVVFLYGMDKGRFPLEYNNTDKEISLEEERRLCYVGMTRAKEELILVCGQEASLFLNEIPAKNAKMENLEKPKKRKTEKAVQMSLFDFMKI